MAQSSNKGTAETGYLLGTLSEEERTRLESEFFANDARFEELEIAEDELIDAYVRDEFSAAERQKFRAQLMTSPRIVERVNFAKALAQKTSAPLWHQSQTHNHNQAESPVSGPEPKSKTRWWEKLFVSQPAFAPALAACVIMLLGGVVLVAGWLRLRSESDRLAAERATIQRQHEELNKQLSEQRTKAEQLAAELQQLKGKSGDDVKLLPESQLPDKSRENSPTPNTFATVFLIPGTVRSQGSKPELIIKPGTTTARLELSLEGTDYPAYNAVITTGNGDFVFRKNLLKPNNAKLLVSVPARLLAANDYRIHLDGVTASGQVEDFDDYAFRVKTSN